jgi:hypothetical protein
VHLSRPGRVLTSVSDLRSGSGLRPRIRPHHRLIWWLLDNGTCGSGWRTGIDNGGRRGMVVGAAVAAVVARRRRRREWLVRDDSDWCRAAEVAAMRLEVHECLLVLGRRRQRSVRCRVSWLSAAGGPAWGALEMVAISGSWQPRGGAGGLLCLGIGF